jgi:polar amino acid transport system substrate-binding protein
VYAIVALTTATGVGCVPPEDATELALQQFSDSSLMAELQERGAVRIGVPTDVAPLASASRNGGFDPQGFTVDLGALVADALGVDAEFVSTPSSMGPVAAQREADLVFTARALTEEAVRAHTYTNPYLLVHQRLLVRSTSGIGSVEDLDGKKVCASIDPRTEVPLEQLNSDIELVAAGAPRECGDLLRRRQVQALAAADVVLMGTLQSLSGTGRGADAFHIVGNQLTTEGYAALVGEGTGGFGSFVDAVFESAEEDGTWSRLYEKWMGPYTGGDVPEPPDLSLEEAAALFPTERA